MNTDIYTVQNRPLQRSDTALTQEIVSAIVQRIRNGKPITKRGRKTLLLDYTPEQIPISVSTYTSWLRRGTVALNSSDNKSLQDAVNEARIEGRQRLHEEMLRKAEEVLASHLDMSTKEKIVHKRINKDGKSELKNGMRVVPKLVDTKQRAAEFVAKKLDPQTYGYTLKTDNRHLVFSLSALRKYEEEKRRQEA